MKKAEEGITLMALIITIIVIVILVAIIVSVAYNSGIIQMGAKGAKDYAEAAIDENKIMEETTTYIDSVAKNIKSLLADPNSSSEEGNDPEEETPKYVKVGETYCNEPDLSGFNKDVTYFVTYNGEDEKRTKVELDENGNASNEPEGWYDYGEKKWANIVTTNGGSNTYWVWIPRYKYTINADEEIVNVKFVDTENNCTEEKDGEKQTVDVTKYQLPESFTFAEKELDGYWISKYEVQDFAEGVGYQANKGTASLTKKTANDFFEGIRNMEATGGTLGTKAVIDIGGKYTDSSENGIDCHMALNTEWGTVAVLAASIYGSAPTGQSTASTTGNDSGVFQMADSSVYEFVAGIYNTSNQYMSKIFNADARYRNLYTGSVSIPGDATTETQKWKGAIVADFVASGYPVFKRSVNALFGFLRTAGASDSFTGSRAVVVCGCKL